MRAALTIPQVVKAVNGELVFAGAFGQTVRAMTWDSREARAGSAFVAFAGERVDGNDFAVQAMRAGAACVRLFFSTSTTVPRDPALAAAYALRASASSLKRAALCEILNSSPEGATAVPLITQ